MADGYPVGEGSITYNPQFPYIGRDPRFYSTIFYNGSQAKVNNTGSVIHTFNAWKSSSEIGEDYAGSVGANLTNLYIKKFIYMSYNPFDTSKTKGGPRSKYIYRWAHLLLNFAEAANEYGGPDKEFTTTDGTKMTARQAMALLRSRATYDDVTPSYAADDKYLTAVADKGKVDFREFIRNERRVETCFEGMRFFDLRRWSTEGDLTLLNVAVHRPEIEMASSGRIEFSDGTTANPHVKVAQRKFTTPYIPIPYYEILRVDGIEQNKGWESWM